MDHTLRTFLTLQRTSNANKDVAKTVAPSDRQPTSAPKPIPTIIVRNRPTTAQPTITVRAITPTPVVRVPTIATVRPTIVPTIAPTIAPTQNTQPPTSRIVQLRPITIPNSLATSTKPTVPQAGRGGGQRYIVGCGETLAMISQNIYGTIEYVDEIMAANKSTITNPETLACGLEITLP
jgi:hypothetical protein